MEEKIKELKEKGYVIPDNAVTVNDDGTWIDAEGIEHAAKKQGLFDKIPTGAIIGVLAAVIAIIAGIVIWMFVIDHTKMFNTITVMEAGNEFIFNPEEYFDGLPEDVAADDFTVDTSTLDNTVPGDYVIAVTYNNKTYDITVRVQDTAAPAVTLNTNYIITNDAANIDLADVVSVKDVTDYTVTVGKFVKVAESQIITDETVTAFTDALGTTTAEELLAREDYVPQSGKYDINGDLIADDSETAEDTEAVMSTETAEESTEETEKTIDEIAAENYMSHEEDGIYSAVIMATDTSGNIGTAEIIVVYDTEAPSLCLSDNTVAFLEDKTVEQKDVTAEPEYDLQDAGIYDVVDGEIADTAEVTITETDADNHVWTVIVKAADRAGNGMEASYTIAVVKKEEEKKPAATTGNNNNNNSNTNNGSTNTATENTGNSNAGSESTQQQTTQTTTTSSGLTYSGGEYILNYNGFRRAWTDGEPSTVIVDWTKQLYNAGYYNPQAFPDGQGYGMITQASNTDERFGSLEYLENYVSGLGHGWSNSGGYNMGEDGNGNNVYYVYVEGLY